MRSKGNLRIGPSQSDALYLTLFSTSFVILIYRYFTFEMGSEKGKHIDHQGEWFNGKTAAFKVADLGSNPCSPANMNLYRYRVEYRLRTTTGISFVFHSR